jgi:hypothetical protein
MHGLEIFRQQIRQLIQTLRPVDKAFVVGEFKNETGQTSS